MDKKLKGVLLAVCIDTHFVELSRVAKLLKQSGEYDPSFWFQNYATLERDLAVCRANGWRYIVANKSESHSPFLRVNLWKYLRIEVRKRLPTTLRSFPWVWYLLGFYRRQTRLIEVLLERVQPNLLIMAEDSIGYHLYTLIRLGRARGIPTVIVPFTIANASEPGQYYADRSDLTVSNSLVNRLIGSRYPHWVFSYKGRDLIRLPAANILALELLGLAPRQPWLYNGEETAVTAVESEFMFQYYRKQGLPVERLIVTGALYDDVLTNNGQNAELHRVALYQELSLPSNRPLLLCALPPSQFPRSCEFTNYEELVRFWLETLAALSGWNVVVRPHPRLTDKEIEPLKGFGVRITEHDTASLIPLCDLYVASVSATIRWAIACGKPVVNYDVYRTGYTDYEEAKGVITMNDQASFVATLRRLTSEPDYYARVTALQRECMTQWGKLDGKSGERMLQLFDDVINGRIGKR